MRFDKSFRVVLAGLLTLILAAGIVLVPRPALASTKYEFFNPTTDDGDWVYGVNMEGQTFTPSETHTVTSVKFTSYRLLSPGTVTLYIKACTSHLPAGSVLSSGTANGNLWGTGEAYNEVAITEITLQSGIEYAWYIAVAAPDIGTGAIRFRHIDAGGYSGGIAIYSYNSGGDWAALGTADAGFEIYGNAPASLAGTTEAATNKGSHYAQLNGTVSSMGEEDSVDCTFQWDYDTGTPYTYETSPADTLTHEEAFDFALMGLTSEDRIYYRAKIVGVGATVYGEEVYFDTTAPVKDGCIYYNSTELTALQVRAAADEQVYLNIEDWADTHLADEPPGQPGGISDTNTYPIWRFLDAMALMYSVTGNEDYADAAIVWMLAIKDWTTWGAGSPPFQGTCAILMGFSHALDAVRDYIDSGDFDDIRDVMVEKADIVVAADYGDANYPNSWAVETAIGLTGLALIDDYPGAAAYVTYASGHVDDYLALASDDGTSFEGFLYGTYSLGFVIPYLDALNRVESVNKFTGSDFLENLPQWYIYLTYDGRPVQYDDMNWYEGTYGGATGDEFTYPVSFMYRIAKEYDNSSAQYWANNIANQNYPMSFFLKDNTISESAPISLTKEFPDAGFAVFRTSWDEGQPYFVFKSGSSRGHAHPDQNSFEVFDNGKPIICGPEYATAGGSDPDKDNSTWANNCIIVDGETFPAANPPTGGQGQEPGDYASVALGIKGAVEDVVDSYPYYRYVRGDAAPPYDGAGNNGNLDSWIRQVVWIDGLNCFVVYDHVTANEAKQFDLLLHLKNLRYETIALTIDSDVITFHKEDGEPVDATVDMMAEVLLPASFANSITEYEKLWGRTYKYIRIHPSVDTDDAEFLLVNTVGDTHVLAQLVSQNNCSGVIIVDDANHLSLALFSNDGSPVDEFIDLGGSYHADDGETYNFVDETVEADFGTYQVMRLELDEEEPTPTPSGSPTPTPSASPTPTPSDAYLVDEFTGLRPMVVVTPILLFVVMMGASLYGIWRSVGRGGIGVGPILGIVGIAIGLVVFPLILKAIITLTVMPAP